MYVVLKPFCQYSCKDLLLCHFHMISPIMPKGGVKETKSLSTPSGVTANAPRQHVDLFKCDRVLLITSVKP